MTRHGRHVWQSEKWYRGGRNFRSENGFWIFYWLICCLIGFFAQKSGKAFNELPLNVKNILPYYIYRLRANQNSIDIIVLTVPVNKDGFDKDINRNLFFSLLYK